MISSLAVRWTMRSGSGRTAGQFIEAAAEIEFRIAESAAGVEETRKALIIEIKSAIHQSNQRRGAQFLFLLGAQKQIIHLIGRRSVMCLPMPDAFETALEMDVRHVPHKPLQIEPCGSRH